MSSGRNTHWCHTCLRPIRLCSRYVICSYCAGESVQALNDMTRSSTFYSLAGHDLHDTGFGMMDEGHRTFMSRDRLEELQLYGRHISFRSFTGHGHGGDPGLLIGGEFPLRRSNYLRERELLFSGGSGSTGETYIGSTRDYFVGSGIEELIEQLSGDGSTMRGFSPATIPSINAMPTIKIKKSHLRSDSKCPICMEIFEVGSDAKKMPCKHIYHSHCIIPWLSRNRSCPVCRYKMPTIEGSTNSTSQGSSASSTNSGRRRNPFSFLWRSRSSYSSTRRTNNNT